MPITKTDRSSPLAEPERLLRVYLQDHRGGATFGRSLAHRAARANAGSELGDTLATVAREIDEDCQALEAIMSRLGLRPSLVKVGMAKLADTVGRLKLSSVRGLYSPVNRVLELEALTSGILAKRHLWQALAAVVDHIPGTDRVELDRLAARADAQIERLDMHHTPAASVAFNPGAALTSHVA